ncbi:ankyrin repeat domain-containing protein [Marivibrio halodurans]|uniref:Ankyrin repeat domain-containing protein n=3 Tax=Marivibrio halodurans TaxID=2039722 RepID=A0A8J7SK46_9PROT|nr:ankyrin repeat domain-containing protein [Marivibrio halodurans]
MTTRNRDELFEALVYGLVADRIDIVSAALDGGADPNRGLSWEFIQRTQLLNYEREYKDPVTDAVWADGGPLTAYSFLLGGWCDDAEKTSGRCVLKGPWSVYSIPSTLYPVFALVHSPQAADLMLQHGAEVDQELLDGTLHTAARFGRAALVRRLAELGARIDSVGVDGMRPMHRAAQFGHAEVISWLLAQGLDPNTGGASVEPVAAPVGGRIFLSPGVGQAGVTPLHIVAVNGSRDMAIDENDLLPLIGGVVPGAPGDRAGLRDGDLIVAVNGRPVHVFEDFAAIVRASPGVRLTVRIERQGQLYETVLIPAGPTGAVGTAGPIAIGAQSTGKAWVIQDRWRPDWREHYDYKDGYQAALELLIAAGAYVDARANWRVIPSWWNATGNLAAFDQTPMHVAYDHYSYEIVEELIENGADENARLATGETPKQVEGKLALAIQTEAWRELEAIRVAETRRQQEADSGFGMEFGQMIALGSAAAITAYGAGQGMGAEALTLGSGMAADILSDGEVGGIDAARGALQDHAASQGQIGSPVMPVEPQPSSPSTIPIPGQLAQACENTLSIGSVQHSFLQISLPVGTRLSVQASVLPAEGGRAVRLESTGGVGNATRVVAQIMIPDRYREPANIPLNDDNTIPGLENGAVGTLDIYRGREYANFRSNFDFGRNRDMGSVQLLEAGSRLRGTFSFDAVEDGYPRRGNQYKADIAGSFCAF